MPGERAFSLLGLSQISQPMGPFASAPISPEVRFMVRLCLQWGADGRVYARTASDENRRAYGRTASSSRVDGARRGPSPSSTGGTTITFQVGNVFNEARAIG